MEAFPKVEVYLSHVLLRLSVTVTADQPESVWRDVFRYSELSDPVRLLYDSVEEKKELEQVRSRIPAKVLEEYLQVRARNHALNRAALGLSGRARTILYGQEDCAPSGLHRIEKETLRDHVGARSNVTIMTGADELNSVLMLCAYQNLRALVGGARPIPILVPNLECLESISLYEDISIRANLEAHLAPTIFRAKISSEPTSSVTAKLVLFPFDAKEGQKDACFLTPDQLKVQTLTAEQSQLLAQIQPGDGILDFSYGNGASPSILRARFWGQAERFESLSVFSAWNTSGNRIGTTIAHWGLRTLALERNEFDPKAERWYRFSQLVDGWFFQSEVRPRINEALHQENKNPWALSASDWKAQSAKTDHELQEQVRLVFGTPTPAIDLPRFRAELPWNRTFEVRLLPI